MVGLDYTEGDCYGETQCITLMFTGSLTDFLLWFDSVVAVVLKEWIAADCVTEQN